MRVKIKKIISFVIFVILLVAAFGKCADVVEYKTARKKYTPFFESETNFDAIFLGTSRMYNHVLPMELWKEYGISSYNWGYANCTPALSYYLAQEVLKYTDPEVLVLDIYGLIEYEKHGNGKYRIDCIEQQRVQLDSIPLSENKVNTVKDVFDNYDDRSDFLWNFIVYHNRWSELGREDFEYELSKEKGASSLIGLAQKEFYPISPDETMELNTVCYDYLIKLLEYCESNKVKLLCVYLPYAAGDDQQRAANTVGQVIEQYENCDYVNMLNMNILDFSTDIYSDYDHLNYSGAVKVTSWLGNYLKENYEMKDYSDNEYWKQDYMEYHEFINERLKKEELLVNYIVQLKNKGYKVEAEIYDEELMENENLMHQFENIGVNPTFVNNKDNNNCVKLKITSNIIKEVNFKFKNNENKNMFEIIKN